MGRLRQRRDPRVPPLASLGDRPARRLAVVLLCSSLAFVSGYLLHRSGFRVGAFTGGLERQLALALKQARASLGRPEVEHLTIDIDLADFMKLESQRQEALARFHLEAGAKDYVPARLTVDGEMAAARVRLKGDWIDHLDSPKWSLRVRMRGDQTVFGMKQFSIQHPKTRNYLYEWIYHEALRREGVIALRYDFIEVTRNGRELGIFALEEHFEKRLLEHNGRPEGPIVRFNEDLMYQLQLQHRPFRNVSGPGSLRRAHNTASSHAVDPYFAVDLDTFQTNQMFSDARVGSEHVRAIHRLEGFRRGELATSEAFDVPQLARFLAISDLLGSQHSHHWRNLRFYYNPATELLEPIGFDGDAGLPTRQLSCVVDTEFERRAPIGERREIFVRSLFRDLSLFEEYVRVLERVSKPAYLEQLMAELDGELQRKLQILHSEFPRFEFSAEVLRRNQEYLRAALHPVRALHAYQRGASGGELELELGNLQALPVEVLGLSYRGSALEPSESTILPAVHVLQPGPVDYQRVRFSLPAEMAQTSPRPGELTLRYRLLGTERVGEVDVFPWSHRSDVLDGELGRAPNASSFDFLVVDEPRRRILVRPGRWSLDRTLVLPAGYTVAAGEGTRLVLSSSAAIVSRSPLDFRGSEESPIVIESPDGSGQGIVVQNAGELSVLDRVAFRGLSAPRQADRVLRGGVTFHGSPVLLSHTSFLGSRSEAALHVVRSDFEIRAGLFGGSSSDDVEVDFSHGSIIDSRFFGTRSTAIDVSGSDLEIRGVVIEGSGEVGVRASARSYVRAQHTTVRGAALGAASEEGSEVLLVGVSISDAKLGLAAYGDDSPYGPAHMAVHGSSLEGVSTRYRVGTNARLAIDGRRIPHRAHGDAAHGAP